MQKKLISYGWVFFLLSFIVSTFFFFLLLTEMERLPFELMDKIFSLLSTQDICSFCFLNHHWHLVASARLYRYPILQSEKTLQLFTENTTEKQQKYIQVLDLTHVHQYVNDRIMSPLLDHVTNLRHLQLSKCSNLTPNTILLLIQNNLQHLSTLSLANCTLSTDILHYIGKANHSQLKFLDLSNTMIKPCTSIDSSNHLDMMITSPSSSSKLVHLNLSYCAWVDSQTVENIANGLPHLEHLILQWCNQVQVKALHTTVQQLNNLKSIDIQHIDSIESKEQACGIFSHAASLKKVLFTCKRAASLIVL